MLESWIDIEFIEESSEGQAEWDEDGRRFGGDELLVDQNVDRVVYCEREALILRVHFVELIA